MKKFLLTLAALAVATLAFAGAAHASQEGEPGFQPVTLCHHTGSETNPFVVITVDDSGALNGHLGHDGDIIPITDRNGDGEITVEDCTWTPESTTTTTTEAPTTTLPPVTTTTTAAPTPTTTTEAPKPVTLSESVTPSTAPSVVLSAPAPELATTGVSDILWGLGIAGGTLLLIGIGTYRRGLRWFRFYK